jgi:drug/metabolite transporter (DMT)-like permease
LNHANLIGGFIAVASALTWGAGDYTGGVASARINAFKVLALAAFAATVSLFIAMLVRGESWPSIVSIGWSVVAGVSGAIGTVSLYQALAVGRASLVAPTSAVVSIIIPVIVGSLTQGIPSAAKSIGLVCGMVGIILVTGKNGTGQSTKGLLLSILAGFGFAGFFLCIIHTDKENVFSSLLVAKLTALVLALATIVWKKKSAMQKNAIAIGLIAGVLDAAGNLFYLLSSRLIRFDLATVIASMAPAVTVLLASILSHQKVPPWQLAGVVFCLIAIILIVI